MARPAPGSILVYDRAAASRRTTWLLMSLFVLILGGLVLGFGYALALPVGLQGVVGILIIGYAVLSYFLSTSIVLTITGAHEVTKEEEWEFVRRVENLCIGAGLPMPRVWVIEDSAPNAFATGRDPEHAHVVVTRGLLNKLEPIELEGVLAHELSHIGNYDIRVMTIATVLVGVVALVSDVLMRFTIYGSGRRSGNRGRGNGGAMALIIIVSIVAAILAPIAAQLIRMAVSRQREFLADASGALLSRNPEALANALEKIASDTDPLEAANKATAHLYIENPLKEHKSFLNNAFSSHPPIEERIRILRSM